MSIYLVYGILAPLFLVGLIAGPAVSLDILLNRVSYSFMFYIIFEFFSTLSSVKRRVVEYWWFFSLNYTQIVWAPFYARVLIRN